MRPAKGDFISSISLIADSSKEEEKKPYGVILEVRAGAGGDEASLFAAELASMYLKYAELQGWQTIRNNVSATDAGGYKEASFEIMGNEVYDHLRFETGVHRVQRTPATEKQGRIHTSTASVAVLPMRKKPTLVINPSDIDTEFSRAGGAGGQNVNKVSTAVELRVEAQSSPSLPPAVKQRLRRLALPPGPAGKRSTKR